MKPVQGPLKDDQSISLDTPGTDCDTKRAPTLQFRQSPESLKLLNCAASMLQKLTRGLVSVNLRIHLNALMDAACKRGRLKR